MKPGFLITNPKTGKTYYIRLALGLDNITFEEYTDQLKKTLIQASINPQTILQSMQGILFAADFPPEVRTIVIKLIKQATAQSAGSS